MAARRRQRADLPFREGVPHNIGTDCRVSIDRAARYIEAVSVFCLNYCHPDGRAAGVAAVEAHALIAARMKAAVAGLDQGLSTSLLATSLTRRALGISHPT